jgi:spore maturation protein CgeB
MTPLKLKIVFIGLSITSSWGNGHATTYRGLMRELCNRGHEVLFLERDVPWYASNRDMPDPPFGRTELYESLGDLKERFTWVVSDADFVIVGSYVPEGVAVGRWVTSIAKGGVAFYDIDTPVTLAKLLHNDQEYLSRDLIPYYHLYLSFTGGPTLRMIEEHFGAPRARALYCSFDPKNYYPEAQEKKWDLGYLGTYSADRQPTLELFMLEPARIWDAGRFIVAGPMYPDSIHWPRNVARVDHLPPSDHRAFYNAQKFTLNVTRADMIKAGYSPSVRLFEAAACATPIISDFWEGLDQLFQPGEEILMAHTVEDALHYLCDLSEGDRTAMGERARQRVLSEHTAAHRAAELEAFMLEVLEN